MTPAAGITRLGPFTLSTVVITHPSRSGLLGRLRRCEPRLEFAVHSDSSQAPSPDSAIGNVLSAWRAIPDGVTHHMVLQDDVLPCVRFLDHLSNAIACAPERGFSMFAEWGSKTAQTIRLAALSGHGWAAVADPWLPAPAVVMPAEMARNFAGYLHARMREGERRDAFLLLSYLTMLGTEAVVSVPNLVEHDLPLVDSLLPNGKVRGPRRATCLAGRSTGTWPPGVTRLPRWLPYHSPHDLVAAMLSEWDGYYGWQSTPAFLWLAERGWSLADIDEAFRDTAARVDLEFDRAPIGVDAIKENWLGAFTLGWVSSDSSRAAEPPAAGDMDETARTALRTLAAGAFRRVLAPRLLDQWSDLAVPMLADALRCGHAAGAKAGAPITTDAR